MLDHWDTPEPETPPAVDAPPVPVEPTEPQAGQPAAAEPEPEALTEPAAEPAVAVDPYAEHRDPNGLIFGKYKTEADVVKGYAEARSELQRLQQETERLRQQAVTQPQQPQGGQDVDPLTQQLQYWTAVSEADPEELRQYEQFAQMSDVQILRQQQRADREIERLAAQAQQQAQAQQAQVYQQQAEQAALSAFYAAHPDLNNPMLRGAVAEVYQQMDRDPGPWAASPQTALEEWGRRVREGLMPVAASLLGQRGGQAAAQQRQAAPPPPRVLPGSGGGNGAAPAAVGAAPTPDSGLWD